MGYMRMIALCCLVFVSSLLNAMEEIVDFGDNPGKLKMYLHVPFDMKGAVPLVVALHGCSQDATELAEQSGWNALADRYGFVVLYPEQRSMNNMSNCFNWFLPKDQTGDRGELASIRNMMDYAAGIISIDSKRIYVYGLSAGAAMANNLLANDPAGFAGGAIFAGGAYGSATNAWQAMQVMMSPKDRSPEEWGELLPVRVDVEYAPKVIVFQGENDDVVDPANALELIDQWSFVHGMDAEPDRVEEKFAGVPQVTRSSYTSAKQPEAVVFYSVAGLGHRLPVDPGNGERQGGANGMFTEDIDFFSTWYVARDFGLIPLE